MPIRFRTQDTRASTRRKLNELFELDGEERRIVDIKVETQESGETVAITVTEPVD